MRESSVLADEAETKERRMSGISSGILVVQIGLSTKIFWEIAKRGGVRMDF